MDSHGLVFKTKSGVPNIIDSAHTRTGTGNKSPRRSATNNSHHHQNNNKEKEYSAPVETTAAPAMPTQLKKNGTESRGNLPESSLDEKVEGGVLGPLEKKRGREDKKRAISQWTTGQEDSWRWLIVTCESTARKMMHAYRHSGSDRRFAKEAKAWQLIKLLLSTAT